MPTAADRLGDFSADQGNSNGNPTVLKLSIRPTTTLSSRTTSFPRSRINPVGQKLLNFFPLPNYSPTISTQLYVN